MCKKIAILFLTLYSFFSLNLQGQVTIGSEIKPNTGSILDLKEDGNTDQNSTRGLALPRVLLDSLILKGGNTNLATTIKNAERTPSWNMNEHIGLTVFNANEANACVGGADKGMYVWDGKRWSALWSDKLVRPELGNGTDSYEGANTYIVMRGASKEIPVKRAFQIWTEYSTGNDISTGHVLPSLTTHFGASYQTATLTADITWQEAFDATTADVLAGTVSVNQVTPIDESTFTVTAGSKSGNALVAIKLDGKTIWQWQIWVPSDDPTTTAYGYNTSEAVYWFMDRYLGASSTEKKVWDGDKSVIDESSVGGTPTNRNAHGLYYQWGRSTPFKKHVNATILSQIALPTKEVENLLAALTTQNFLNIPLTDNTANQNTLDWYSNILNQWETRWGSGSDLGTGSKTAFDPCPQGWKVPGWENNKSPFNCLGRSLESAEADYSGYNFDDLGRMLGYWPASGYRARSSSYLYDVGTHGTAWTATPTTMASPIKATGASRIFFRVDNGNKIISATSEHNRANGLSVRCVQDNI